MPLIHKHAVLALALALGVVAWPANAETQPAPGLTTEEATAEFGHAMLVCLVAVVNGQPIRQQPESQRATLKPATPDDRKWAGDKVPPGAPVMVSTKLGHLLTIAEVSADRCEVHAIQLPVDQTFQDILYAMSKAFPDFKAVAVKPGYNPIAYQLESTADGMRTIIRMEGAEPGAPGHELRFSLLYGYVLQEPARTDPPKAANDSRVR